MTFPNGPSYQTEGDLPKKPSPSVGLGKHQPYAAWILDQLSPPLSRPAAAIARDLDARGCKTTGQEVLTWAKRYAERQKARATAYLPLRDLQTFGIQTAAAQRTVAGVAKARAAPLPSPAAAPLGDGNEPPTRLQPGNPTAATRTKVRVLAPVDPQAGKVWGELLDAAERDHQVRSALPRESKP